MTPELNIQLLFQPFLIIANDNLTIDINDRHSKLSGLIEHLFAGNFVRGNIKSLISDFVCVQQLLDFNAPRSRRGRINLHLFRHLVLLLIF